MQTTRLSKKPNRSSQGSKSLGLFWKHPTLQITLTAHRKKPEIRERHQQEGNENLPFLLSKLLLHFRDLWTHYKGWKGGKYWEDSLFLLTLSQFFIWDAATSLIQRQIMWTPCVFLAPDSRVFSDENKLQSTMEKGSEVTLLLAKLEPDTLNNFNSFIL